MTYLHQKLNTFTHLANQLIFEFYGLRSTCIFSTGVVCDTLNQLGLNAVPLRVTCAVFPNQRDQPGCTLGSDGDGSRQPAAAPGYWKGHLVSLVENEYLLDTTADQINDKHQDFGATPVTLYLPETQWHHPHPQGAWTGLLPLFPNSLTRYSEYHIQRGWVSSLDWRRKGAREEMTERLVEACHQLSRTLEEGFLPLSQV